MGINTGFGSRSEREELSEAMEVHNDNRRVIGFVATGSAILSVVFAYRYGIDSRGAMLFAAGTAFGGVLTAAEAMDYSVSFRELANLEDPA
jgi:hypothetical protein